jgi:hypothetical protein
LTDKDGSRLYLFNLSFQGFLPRQSWSKLPFIEPRNKSLLDEQLGNLLHGGLNRIDHAHACSLIKRRRPLPSQKHLNHLT